MALAVTQLTSGTSTTNSTTVVTSSVTPTADALVLLAVFGRVNNTPPSGVTGNGLTWVMIDSSSTSALSLRNISLWRALGSSPSAGAITVTWVGTQTEKAWSVFEITGVDTSGTNGSGAIVQSVKNGDPANSNSPTLTLSAFGSANNMAVGFFHHFANEVTTPGSGFTEIHDLQLSESAAGNQTEYKLNDTTVDASWATVSDWLGIAVEVKEGSGATAPSQVTGLVVSQVSTSSLSLSWTAPSNGGSAITGYLIERESPTGGGFSTLVADTGNTNVSYVDTGLTDATEYNYRVSAINAIGTGTASAEDAETTGTPAVQTTFYFSTSGSNTTGDGTSGNPWQNFKGKKNGNGDLNPGDICYFNRGDVWTGSSAEVVVNSNGTSGNPIILDAYGTGNDPVFAGAAVTTAGWTNVGGTSDGGGTFASNIWSLTGQSQTHLKTVVQGTTTALGKWRGTIYTLPEGTFIRSGTTLYVHCWSDADPSSADVRVGSYSHSTTADGARGLVSSSRNGAYGDYVHFKNLKVLGANGIGFSSSGLSNQFFDCTAIGCGQEGILFYCELAGSGENADGGRWWRGEVAYCAAGGTSFGQGCTTYAPRCWWVGSSDDPCYVHDNFMAGIDFLYASSTNHNATECGAAWCKVIDNGRWQDSASYDPNIYIDGANKVYIYGCLVAGSGLQTGATNSKFGIKLGSENLPGNVCSEIYMVNNLIYRNNSTGIYVANLNSTYDNITGVYIINNTIMAYLAGSAEQCFFMADYATGSDIFTMRNNIFISGTNGRTCLYTPTAANLGFLDADYNVYYRTNGSANVFRRSGATDLSFTDWKTDSTEDAASLNTDPMIVSTTEADGTIDVHLDPSSPALNLGTATPIVLPSWIPTDIFTYEGGAVRGTTLASGVFDDTSTSIDAGFHYNSDEAAPAASSYTPRCGLMGVG